MTVDTTVVADTTPPPGVIGASCNKDADCGAELTCLNWPGGYCTKLDCASDTCPSDSTCVGLAGGNTACLATCETTEDCAGETDQACKTFTPVGKDEARGVCHGVDSDAQTVGGPCGDATDCQGPAVCHALTVSGYCAIPGCEADACPAGTACITTDSGPFCLRACESAEDCVQLDDVAQQCKEKKRPDGAKASVCVAAAGEKAIGDYCVDDVECESGTCEILGDGRCSQSEVPCWDQQGCAESEFCNIGPASKVGICSKPCSVAAGCPGLGFCVEGLTSTCRKPCSGIGDASCKGTDGFTCMYGYPLGLGTGTYVCHLDQAGATGSSCEDASACASGICHQGSCAEACGTNYSCPFPTHCAAVPDEGLLCLRACFSNVDCPDGSTCDTAPGGIQKVCL